VTPWEFVIVTAAAARIWWLFAKDDITEPIRLRLHWRIADWLGCPWCAGFWITAAAVAAFHLGLPLWPYEIFAASLVVAIAAMLTARLMD
jgi:hypothetical protein